MIGKMIEWIGLAVRLQKSIPRSVLLSMWVGQFLTHYGNRILQKWNKNTNEEFPELFDVTMLTDKGDHYLKLVLDTDIPLEEHPYFEVLFEICKHHSMRGTPAVHLFHIFHIFRDVLIEALWSFQMENELTEQQIRARQISVHQRIDSIQRTTANIYWNHAINLINQKQKEIEKLHDDRLSMLGKMAASMAHEIRNPLFAIEGFLKLIRNNLEAGGRDIPKLLEYIDIVDNEFDGLYRQVSAFLSFSRNNGVEERKDDYVLSDIINPVISIIQPRLVNENIELICRFAADSPIAVQKIATRRY